VITFDGVDDDLHDTSVTGSDLFSSDAASIFIVGRVNSGTVVFEWLDGLFDRVAVTGTQPRLDFGDAFSTPLNGTGMSAGYHMINTQASPGSQTNLEIYVDGKLQASGQSSAINPLNLPLSGQLFLGEYPLGGFNAAMDLAEVIVFNTNLNSADRLKVESYLAVKYGIMLDQTTPTNYVDSGGNVIWNATTNASYNNDIAGIGQDDSAALDQTQSHSLNSDGVVTFSAASSQDNGDFLLLGNNNGALTETNTGNPTGVLKRLNRSWRVDETGEIGTTTVSFDVSGLPISGTVAADFKLLIDTDTDFTSGSTLVSASSYSGHVVTFTGVNLNDGQYFTLGTSVTPDATNPLWLTTDGDVTSGGQTGTDTWQKGDLVQIAGPNLAFEPGTTSGTFSVAFDADLFAPGKNVDAIHYVSRDIQVGASNFQLKAGDLLLSLDNGATLVSSATPVDAGFTNNLTVSKADVFVFRSGTFAMLLEDPTGGGHDIRAISLIEQNTTVGDVTLQAGDFLFIRSGGAEDSDVWLFETTDVGAGNTSGTASVLLEGTDTNVSIGQQLRGVELVEESMTIGGRTLNSGTILLSVDASGNVGSNNLLVSQYDIFALDVTQTTFVAGPGNGAATASLFLEGADVAFNTSSEKLDDLTLTVVSQNNAPTATITPASYAVSENTPLSLHGTGLAVSDPDAGSNAVHVTLSVGEGTLTVGAGTTGVMVSNSGTTSVTLNGTLTQVNNLLAGNLGATVVYTASDTPSASTLLTLAIDDLGNSGIGGSQTANDTATLTIAAQNDAPIATITPASYAVTEGTPLPLHGTGLSMSDADAGTNGVHVTLSVGEGTLSVGSGLTGVTVAGSGTSSVTLDGTLTQVNDLLAGNSGATITYQAIEAPSASTTLTLAIDDLGNSGGGGSQTANDMATLNITAQNDAPTATITPASYAVSENTPLSLHGTGLAINDPDAGTNAVRVTLSVGEGTLTVGAGTTGVTVSNSGTTSVTLDGTLTQVNNLLAGSLGATIAYQAVDTPSASTTLTLAIDDLGNTGTGGSQTANDTATLNITAQNDAPTATITPTSYAVTEDTPLTLHGTGLAVSDPDAATSVVRVTLSVGEGTLTVGTGTTGVTVAGSGTSSVTLDGTVTQLNNLLAGVLGAIIAYQAGDALSASTTLTLAIDDLGNTGAGGSRTANDTATLNIAAQNDAPTATITPASYAVSENTPLSLHSTGLSVSDLDAGTNIVRVTLSVGEGTLTVGAGTTGVTVTNSGTASVTLNGTLTQLNNLLAGNLGATIVYTANDTPSASTILTLAIDDLGNSGGGGSQTANDTATLNITTQNDAPTATITPTSYAVTEDTPLTLHGTGLSVSDPDAGANVVRVTLTVGEGTLTVAAGTTGVIVTTSGTASVTLDGTLTQVNNLLAGTLGATIAYQAVDTPSASATLTLAIDDLGCTGTGGSQTASDNATLTITAQNDAPTATIMPASYAVSENTPLSLHGTGLAVNDPDAGTNAVRVTLSVGEGTLTVGAGTTGVTVTNSGTASVTLDGTLTQLNNLLAGTLGATVGYQAIATPSATTTLTLAIDDLGNTGTGGPHSATATVTMQLRTAVELPSVDESQTPALPEPQSPNPISFTPQPLPQPATQGPVQAPNAVQLSPDINVLNTPAESVLALPPPVAGSNGLPTGNDNTNIQVGGRVNFAFAPSRMSDKQPNNTRDGTLAPNTARTVTPEAESNNMRINTSPSDKLSSPTEVSGFVQELDKLRTELRKQAFVDKAVVGSTLAMTTGLSVGYVVWLLRGGMLLSSILSSLPAWRLVDPLPVLASLEKGAKKDQADDESLESVIRQGANGMQSPRDPRQPHEDTSSHAQET
jgi:hypothetical protein